MKKYLFIASIISVLLFTACADNKTINGITYRPYGLFNENSCKNDSVEYQIAGDAVFSGIFFAECLFIPTIYTFGYNLYEPVGLKNSNKSTSLKGVVE